MKTILCYGDSNTWGYIPNTGSRFGYEERWPGVLRKELGEGFLVIEEGLNGRTTVFDDEIMPFRNGRKYLTPCLETHKPIDLVILMLGTNDMKKRYSNSPLDIARGVEALIKMIKKSECGQSYEAPEILLMCPPHVGRLSLDFSQIFEGAEEKSRRLGHHYRMMAEAYKCHFIDTSEIIIASEADGIHLDMEEHKKLGLAAAELVKRIFIYK